MSSQNRLAQKTKVGQSTIGRAINLGSSASVTTVDALAKGFDIQAWQLLHPTLGIMPPGTHNDPMLLQLIDLFSQLSPDSRHEVVAHVNHLVAIENPHATSSNPYAKAPPVTHAVQQPRKQRYLTSGKLPATDKK